MTTPLPVSGLSPYVTPELLTQAPTGISWNTITGTRNNTAQQLLAAQANLCATASDMVDDYCAQPLRATIDPLELTGPGPRVQVPQGGLAWRKPAKLIMKRWPVLSVVSVQVSVNTFPRSWTTVPAGYYEPSVPVAGLYGSIAPPAGGEGGQAVTLAAGYLDWRYGHDGYVVQCSYVNGWPHCGLTAAAAAGTSALTVDDCTGWALTSAVGSTTGATGTVYDAGNQEVIHVTSASATQGPGTLTLASPLTYGHAAGVIVSTLPRSVIMATIWYAASIALTRGATATSNREIPASGASTAGPKSPEGCADEAEMALAVYRRII